MKATRVLTSLLLLGLLVGSAATVAVRADPAEPEVPVASAFTYQGRLTDSGGPVEGACDLRFRLWDAASGGSQVGSTLTLTGVAVSGGMFTAQLDFGASAFQGDARWLQIGVRCPAGSGSYTWLTPRQALTASPYALYALRAPWSGLGGVPPGLGDGDDDTLGALTCASGQIAEWNGANWVCGDDDTSGGGAHDHWGDSWSGVGTGLALHSYNTVGLLGHHDSTTGHEPGVKGATDSRSTGAIGVAGEVTSASAADYSAGVKGTNASAATWSIGVWGAAQGNGQGVYGTTVYGTGVRGDATDGSSENYGVKGISSSANGTGVRGTHNNESGSKPGVEGQTYSHDVRATGVLGEVVPAEAGPFSAGVRTAPAGLASASGASRRGMDGACMAQLPTAWV